MKAHEIEGKLVRVVEPTMTGTREVLGVAMPPMMLTEAGAVTHATVTGEVLTETVRGLPIPLTVEESVTLGMLPIASLEIL